MKCPECHRTVQRKDRFCPYCGARVTGKTAPARKKNTSQNNSQNWPLVAAIFALGLAVGAFAIYATRTGNTPGATPSVAQATFDPTLRGPQLAQRFPLVYEVAAQFMCPCGSCNDGLEVCDCDMPRGAVEVRGFIYAQVQAGHKAPHITEMVEEKYGHRKNGAVPAPIVPKIDPKLNPIVPK